MIIWALDSLGSVIHRSRSWFELTGFNLDDQRSQIITGAVHPHDIDDVNYIFNESFENRVPFLFSCRIFCKNSQYIWVLTGASPAFSPVDGSFLGYFGSTQPITSSKFPQKVLNILDDDFIEENSPQLANHLDSLTNHLITAKLIASRIDSKNINKALDTALLILGNKFSDTLQK